MTDRQSKLIKRFNRSLVVANTGAYNALSTDEQTEYDTHQNLCTYQISILEAEQKIESSINLCLVSIQEQMKNLPDDLVQLIKSFDKHGIQTAEHVGESIEGFLDALESNLNVIEEILKKSKPVN